MMKIIFGLALDDSYYPFFPFANGGTSYAGLNGLIQILESHYGCTVNQSNIDYIRIEQYRQALKVLLQASPNLFFHRSFQADEFATATDLLSRRDELVEAGWDFNTTSNCPERLRILAQIESIVNKRGLLPGISDRIRRVCELIGQRNNMISSIQICEPSHLLPPVVQQLFQRLETVGVKINSFTDYPNLPSKPDLKRFQDRLKGRFHTELEESQADGSLLLIKGQSDSRIAMFLAKLAQQNPSFSPLTLLPSKTRGLENAFHQEGVPGMGILTSSLSRPVLQLLKLVSTFIWAPLSPFQVLEFLSLPLKPLDSGLSFQLASCMAKVPGVRSDAWYATTNQYFEKIRQRAQDDKQINPDDIIAQYKFWFERRRYKRDEEAPKDEIIAIYRYLHVWAKELFDEKDAQSLLILSEQAKRLTELLMALPETSLSPLALERLVRTIYEPAPIQFKPAEKGHWPYIYHPAAIFDYCPQLLWWNFIESEPVHFFSRWYQQERNYLNEFGIKLMNPAQENDLLVWSRKNPILRTRDQLLLCIPDTSLGKETQPHPLMGDLQATFKDLSPITIDVNNPALQQGLLASLNIPKVIELPSNTLGTPKALVELTAQNELNLRPEETFSSLNDLFFYPHKWFFKHQLKLNKVSILSIVEEKTLMGNLAHRLIEQLLKANPFQWNKEQVYEWVSKQTQELLQKEGAVLLLYGKEPTRISFIKKLQYASWSLINLIKQNNWSIYGIEKDLTQSFQNITIKGRVDLILKRNNEFAIIDLKWRGINYRREMIKNEEDLQLVLYAHLLQENSAWPHTAYFIIERGAMIARNNLAFKEVDGINPNVDHEEINLRILERMQKTLAWRAVQLGKKQIEIRCGDTANLLEELYGEQLLELLEMRSTDARFDDYRTLIDILE